LKSDLKLSEFKMTKVSREHYDFIVVGAGAGVDKLAVVDPELRVHGILGLRVADASVMPQIITGPGTNASTRMIAGRAAKLILG
jgi:choline dehydrogenase